MVERPTGLGELELSVTPPRRQAVEAELVERYAALGVHRLVLHLPHIAPAVEPLAVAFVAVTPGALGV